MQKLGFSNYIKCYDSALYNPAATPSWGWLCMLFSLVILVNVIVRKCIVLHALSDMIN